MTNLPNRKLLMQARVAAWSPDLSPIIVSGEMHKAPHLEAA
ncbi:hypothetical protein QF047_004338 [Arthrobacter sp. W4I7]|nr:hypothetical protein [Arthrobacter sp. W4I7]